MFTKRSKALLLVGLLCLLILDLRCSRMEELKVIQVKKPGIPVVYFEVMFRAGSAYDPPGKEGLAYFTGTMLERGTESFSRDQVTELLDQISGRLNVQVHKEVIVISGTTLKENLDDFYKVLTEVILKPTFPEEQIEKTKVDQLDAIENVRQDDIDLVRQGFENYIFRGHPYGHLVCGNESSVKSLTRQDVLDFYHRYFVKNNVLLGLAGDFDQATLERFKKDMSGLEPGQAPELQGTVQPIVGRKVLLIEKEGRAQTQLRIGHPYSLTRTSSDYFPLLVANVYLGKHRESIGRLYKTVRMQRGLSYGAYSYIEHFEQAGWGKLVAPNIPRLLQYFSMWTYVKSLNAKFAIKLCLKELTDLVREGISEDRLEFTRNFEENQFAFQIETPERKLGLLLDDEFYGTPGFLESYERSVGRVTRAEASAAARVYLSPESIAIVALVSDGEQFKMELLSDQTVIEYPSQADTTALRDEDTKIKAFDLGLREEDFEIVKASELFK